MYGEQLHISVWETKIRCSGHRYIQRRNYIDRIVSKEQAEKLSRHYNRKVKQGVIVHE